MRALKLVGTAAVIAIPLVVLWVVFPVGLLFVAAIVAILVFAALQFERRRQLQQGPGELPVTNDVLKRINREFHEPDRKAVIEILAEFVSPGCEPTFQVAVPAGLWRTFVRWLDDRGRARLHNAILQLSKGNIDDVRFYMEQAKRDVRDVLSWAEYGYDPPRRPDSGPPDFSKLSSDGSV